MNEGGNLSPEAMVLLMLILTLSVVAAYHNERLGAALLVGVGVMGAVYLFMRRGA
ncbi:hypothetical protein [Streptomyces virginiae]